MVSKIFTFIVIVVISIIIGCLYGILNDQLTFSISNEYYTKFKFNQFGLISEKTEYSIIKPRILVTITGIIATWWIGLIFGITLGGVSLFKQSNYKSMFRQYFKSILIVLSITFLIGLIGLGIGLILPAENFNIPENILNQQNYFAVGSMHNFSYADGLIGLIAGVLYNLKIGNK